MRQKEKSYYSHILAPKSTFLILKYVWTICFLLKKTVPKNFTFPHFDKNNALLLLKKYPNGKI